MWASAHTGTRFARWRLALALWACRGRVVSRAAFIGIWDLATLGRLVELRGVEHLAAAGRGVVFLGFHLGPTNPHIALRMSGHRVTWIAGRRNLSQAWPPELQAICNNPRETGSQHQDKPSLLRALYHARRLLASGDSVYITADGRAGATVFEVPLPGGTMRIRQGWLFLREISRATVLPILTHYEGRVQIVTVHPPLPPLGEDRVRDLEVCRERLAALVTDHVRRFPEQCYGLAFPREIAAADAELA